MSDLSVGKKGSRRCGGRPRPCRRRTRTFHSEHGDVPCQVIVTNSAMKAAGAGDVFNVWSVVGKETGAFTVH